MKMENGMNVIYLRLLRAFYGCMDSTILSYDLDSKTLKSQGFVVNIYDMCLANSSIDGKHYMIAWFAADNNILNVEEHMYTRIIKAIG